MSELNGFRKPNFLLFMLLLLALSGCGESERVDGASFESPDNTQEVLDYYASKPDFFTFKSLADLPTQLTWEDGLDLPDIGSPKAKKGGTQYGYVQDFPRTLRWVGPDSNGSFRLYLWDDTAVPIAHQHPNFPTKHYPGLAQNWAIDQQSATIYVKLNAAAKWSDGERVTVDDFMFMFFMFQSEYILSPWFNNNYSTQFTNITKYDELTFSISQPASKPNLNYRILTLVPIAEHFFKELGDDFVERYQWKFWPTTGPYVIQDKDIKKGHSITLTRNDDWWAKDNKYYRNRFNPDRLHISVVRDPAKQFELFKRGDVDLFRLNLVEYWHDKLPDTEPDVQNGYIHKTTFYNQRPRPMWGLWMNNSRAMLNNRDVRMGVQHATNWQLVIDKFYRGDFDRLKTANDGYAEFSHPSLTARDYDIALARSFFAKAGFDQSGPDGILINKNGERLSLTMTSGYVNRKDVLTILKEEARKAGMEFRIELLDGTTAFKKVREKKTDIYYGGLSAFVEMYPRFWEITHSFNAYDKAFLEDGSINPLRKLKAQTNNFESFANYEFDQVIDQYRASSDTEEMVRLAHRLYEMHHEEASFSPGAARPYFRAGYWRWVQWPNDFNMKIAAYPEEFYVHWLDLDLKAATLAAKKSGESFEPGINVYNQYRD